MAVRAWVKKGPIHQMKSICARETTVGHVMMEVIIVALIGVVCFMGHMP
jgi:hypothetical protein